MREKITALFAEHRHLTLLIIVSLVIVGYIGWRWATEPDRRLYALDTATGRVLWTASLAAVRRPLSPTAANQRVFAAYVSAVQERSSASYNVTEFRVSAFDSRTGNLLWEYKPNQDFFGQVDESAWPQDSVVAIGDSVYLLFQSTRKNHPSSPLRSLIALDAATGTQRWTLADVVMERLMPAPLQRLGDHLFVLVRKEQGAQLLMIDPQTGQTIREVQNWDDFILSGPIHVPYLVSNSRAIYLHSEAADPLKSPTQVIAYDPATAKPLFRLPQDDRAAIWCDEVNLYVLKGSHRVTAYDALTGQSRWTFDPEEAGGGAFHFSAGLGSTANLGLVIADMEGDLHRSDESWLLALNAQDGQLRWSRPYASFLGSWFYPPVGAKDMILVLGGTDQRGGIMALSTVDGSELWHFVTQGVGTDNQYSSPLTILPAVDGTRTFAISYSAHLAGLLSQINPNWH